MRGVLIASLVMMSLTLHAESSVSGEPEMRHQIVLDVPGKFAGWPANNGVWSWDDGREIVVGCTLGGFREQQGHNIQKPYRSVLVRSTDGGNSWQMEDPEDYVGDGRKAVECPGGIDFSCPDIAIRCVGAYYHGADDTEGSFFVSENRGRSWRGPFRFNKLNAASELASRVQTPRTDYLALDKDCCLFFLSARPIGQSALKDRSYVARTDDGGATFRFVSWIIPPADPHRAVMPSTALIGRDDLACALRRRTDSGAEGWIDLCFSRNGGEVWTFRSRVGTTGAHNGNPPALIKLRDGRLCCAYGNRGTGKMMSRISDDRGAYWGPEIVLRDDYRADRFSDSDFGYPRLVQLPDGRITAFYYFATEENPEHHIAATSWAPPPLVP